MFRRKIASLKRNFNWVSQKKDVALKWCIFDPKLKKPKCVCKVVDCFHFCKYRDFSATVLNFCNLSDGARNKVPMNNEMFTNVVQ